MNSFIQETKTPYRQKLETLLEIAGIRINGPEGHDIQVKNPALYKRVMALGSLGLGEAYMDGWWECSQLDEFFNRVLRARLDKHIRSDISMMLRILQARLWNRQTATRAKENASFHYNIGNDLFSYMLDKRLTYTCAYWKEAQTLDEAQEAKLELTCRKMHLQPGMQVLDIGCGWGSFARYAAEKYQVQVTGVTLSEEQLKLGQALCQGLPVELKLQDYRAVQGQFDRIVSLGMFEHVGYKNYRSFFEVAGRCLKKDGLLLLHTIGSDVTSKTTDPWISKYIFPNSLLPSLRQISKAFEGLFIMEDLQNFGAYYDRTLMAWHDNFVRNWDHIKEHYGERFYRMWQYYLLCCAGSFRARKNQLWQMVFSKGTDGVYAGVR